MCIRDSDHRESHHFSLLKCTGCRERFSQRSFRIRTAYPASNVSVRGKDCAAPADSCRSKQGLLHDLQDVYKRQVLHPLPRIDEIKLDVDNDPHAAYFDQVHNGVYIRMAIILALLGIPF